MSNHDEYKIHIAIVKHIRSAFPQVGFFHPTNEQRDAKSAFFGKMMGVRPGTSDLIIGWAGRNVAVLEIKTDDGRISTAQNKFLSWADHIGWSTGVARSVAGAHRILCDWGLKPAHSAIIEPDLRSFEQKKKDAFDMYKP